MKKLGVGATGLMTVFAALMVGCGGSGGSGGGSPTAQTPNPGAPVVQQGAELMSTSTVQLYNSRYRWGCAGVVISEDVILTVGRCLKGGADLTVIRFQDTARTVRSAHIIWRSTTINANRRPYSGPGRLPGMHVSQIDLGLVHFTGGLPAGVVPARLLRDANLFQRNNSFYLSEYSVQAPTSGPAPLPGGRFMRPMSDLSFSQDQVLLSAATNGVCSTQVGGPAYVIDQNQPWVFGLSNFNGKAGDCSAAIAYTRVDTYVDWIQQVSLEMHNQYR